MPKYSKRGEKMPESPIRKLIPYALKAKKQGIKVYHLNIGQPDIETPASAIDALKNIHLNFFEYSLSEGSIEFRQTLTKYYHSLGFNDVTPENFIVTNGGSEALNIALSCICDDDDEIIIPEPFYANYNGFSEALGIRIIPVCSSIKNNFALPEMEDFENKITPKTRAILICNPNNPTGYLYSKEELEKLKNIALKHDIFLIADEVYREYIYDGSIHHSILEFPELKEHAIVIDSESKRYNMCGARIGMMVSRSKKFVSVALKFAQARLSPVLLGQIAANAAHNAPKEYIDKVRKENTERRNLLVNLLKEIPGVTCPMPKGAFYCMAELPVDDAEKFSKWLLDDYQYEGETVMLAPAEGFYSNHEIGKKQVRIAYVLKKEDLKKSVEILKHAIEAYNQK